MHARDRALNEGTVLATLGVVGGVAGWFVSHLPWHPLCALGFHKMDDTPNHVMRETRTGQERRIEVWLCHRCPYWKTRGLEDWHERT